jgi:hypothetical protein
MSEHEEGIPPFNGDTFLPREIKLIPVRVPMVNDRVIFKDPVTREYFQGTIADITYEKELVIHLNDGDEITVSPDHCFVDKNAEESAE